MVTTIVQPNISEANFYTLLEGGIVGEGVGASYDFELVKNTCLSQTQPFPVAAAAAIVGAPSNVIGAKLNQWEQAKLFVKVKVSGRGLFLKREGIPANILKVYDAKKVEATKAIALVMQPTED